MGVDLGEFEQAGHRPGPKCFIAILPFTDEQRSKVDGALARRDITAAAIARVLNDWGYILSRQSVERHRRGECRCGKDE
jgi:hypothetical protein